MSRTTLAAPPLTRPAFTASAPADAREALRNVGGLAALRLPGMVIGRNRPRDSGRTAAVGQENGGQENGGHGRFRHRDIRILPKPCFDSIRTRPGTVSGDRARCTRNAVAQPGHLPPRCLAQVRTGRGRRTLYDARSLRGQGWTSRAARR